MALGCACQPRRLFLEKAGRAPWRFCWRPLWATSSSTCTPRSGPAVRPAPTTSFPGGDLLSSLSLCRPVPDADWCERLGCWCPRPGAYERAWVRKVFVRTALPPYRVRANRVAVLVVLKCGCVVPGSVCSSHKALVA